MLIERLPHARVPVMAIDDRACSMMCGLAFIKYTSSIRSGVVKEFDSALACQPPNLGVESKSKDEARVRVEVAGAGAGAALGEGLSASGCKNQR